MIDSVDRPISNGSATPDLDRRLLLAIRRPMRAVMEQQAQRLWGVDDVAEFLGVPVTTLYQWRYQRYGPPGRRVGRYVRYDPAEVRAWFAALDDGAD